MDKTGNKITGNAGEDAAAKYLLEIGYKILARNLRLFCGEFDILAEDKKTVVIVEVKTVRGSGFGLAQELVRFKKQNKLRLLARAIEQQYPNRALRIDLIGVEFHFDGETKIEHLVNCIN
jgi:putative endonuclease